MLVQDIIDLDTFSNSSCKGNIGSCFDAIWNHLMSRSMQLWNTINDNNICPCSPNMGSHVVEQGHHIDNFRFPRRIFDHCPTFSLDCCQNRIDRCTDTNSIHVDVSSLKRLAISRKFHTRAIHGHSGSHRFKGLQMQIDRTWSKVTPTRQSNRCLTIAS